MTSLGIPFQCAEFFIGQAGCIISHHGLTLGYSSKSLPFYGFDNKQKIDCLVNRYCVQKWLYYCLHFWHIIF